MAQGWGGKGRDFELQGAPSCAPTSRLRRYPPGRREEPLRHGLRRAWRVRLWSLLLHQLRLQHSASAPSDEARDAALPRWGRAQSAEDIWKWVVLYRRSQLSLSQHLHGAGREDVTRWAPQGEATGGHWAAGAGAADTATKSSPVAACDGVRIEGASVVFARPRRFSPHSGAASVAGVLLRRRRVTHPLGTQPRR